MNREVTSKSIQGIADLVVCAPIKPGFIDAFENVTYATRLRLATEAFHAMRVTAREYETIRPFADVAERIQSLLAFRIGILDTKPQPSLILAATFDRAWEPYIRLIWDPLGPFLDVLLCNCEGYVTAKDHSFAEYAQWVRDHQVNSAIFYATTPLTVTDQLYLIKLEQLQRAGGAAGSDDALARISVVEPEVVADTVLKSTFAAAQAKQAARPVTDAELELQKQFLVMAGEALVVLYRLADYYPPDRPDGLYLRRAARDLFNGWDTRQAEQLPPAIRERFEPMFAWLEAPEPPAPPAVQDPPFDRSEVQGGILSGYDQPHRAVKHGGLLMFSVTDAGRARAFIASLMDQVSWEGDQEPRGDLEAFVNLAITGKGLAWLGVPAKVVDSFPKEFRDGMEARATLMGDIGVNHPRNWTLPKRFAATPGAGAPRVELSEIDFIVQLRTTAGDWGFVELPDTEAQMTTSNHPLAAAILRLSRQGELSGAKLISVQPMRRLNAPRDADGSTYARDHFGEADMVSQPALAGEGVLKRDEVKPGELVLGYANDRGDAAPPENAFLRNGTFLVIRKMSQDVGALDAFLEHPPGANPAVTGEALLAKMVGRARDGGAPEPVKRPGDNDFDYSGDPEGDHCPLQAHIRRANPRTSPFGRPTPRLMRRGMSYGPTRQENSETDDRGLVFMAYGSNIAEQYETIQRWINGGNSTYVAGAQGDPLVGVQPIDGPRTFRFVDGGAVVRVDIEKPFVGLHWGLYLFTPSRAALASIAASPPRLATIGDPARGETIIRRLSALPEDQAPLAWKTYLEDFIAKDPAENADTPDIWAAIREHHQGTLRTPQGVLVASDRLVNEVYLDAENRYSVAGQGERMSHSFGEIFIGLDPGPRYEAESAATNAAIMAVPKAKAFAVGRESARRVLLALAEKVIDVSMAMGTVYPAELDLRRDFITPTLALICKAWFGLPDLPSEEEREADPKAAEQFVQMGGWSWDSPAARMPRCPGDYMAPSRYCFYPDPTPAITDYGVAQGQALRAAAKRYIDALRPAAPGTAPAMAPRPPGVLTQAMMKALPDNDLVARNLIGIMTGALPPIDGNLRAVLYEWLKEKTLWRFQRTLFAAPGDIFEWAQINLEPPMKQAMQKRPAPDLLWRDVLEPHWLGVTPLSPGDRVILSVVSVTQEKQNTGLDDVAAIFGGRRQDPVHPVHACPAYEMSMGTMLGILTALLEVGEIQALPQPLLVRITPLAGL